MTQEMTNNESTSLTVTQADELLSMEPVKVNVVDLINALPREKAEILAGVYKRIRANDIDGDADTEWHPDRIKVASGKSQDEPEDCKKGDFYNVTLKKKVDKPVTMFPLFSHTELTKWAPQDSGDKRTLAKSIDGKVIKDLETGVYFNIEDLPVKPGRYVGMKNSGYEYAKIIYFVDKEFTNIYKLLLKSYGLGECYDPLTSTTKFNTNYDPTCHKKWFTLTSKDVAHNYGTSYVFAASLSDEDMSEEDINMILFYKECARKYYDYQLSKRDADKESIEAKTESLNVFETEGVTTEKTEDTTTGEDQSFDSI